MVWVPAGAMHKESQRRPRPGPEQEAEPRVSGHRASCLLSSFYTPESEDSGRGLELRPFINIPLSMCV